MRISLRAGDIIFYAAIAFLCGIFAANSGWNLWLTSMIGVLLAMMFGLYFASRTFYILIAMIVACAITGIFYYYIFIAWQNTGIHLPAGKQAAYFGVVTAEPKAAGNFIMLIVSLSHPYAGTLDIFTMPNSDVRYGDELWIEGVPDISKTSDEPPAVFLPKLRIIAQHQAFWPQEILIDMKEAITTKIVEAFPADQASLLAGIITGTTATLSAALKAQMETSGTTYIVNMYGYKIAVLTAAVAAALKDRISRRALLAITLGAIAIFVLASGGAISAVRAAVMGSFAIIARGTGRFFNPRNAVTFAVLGMVLANATLLTDAGFQLSFLSFLGIYYLRDPVNNYFHWTDGGMFQWKEHAMLSLTTNLAILPIVMNTFGEFSLTSLISNILIMIPWLPVITFGGLFVALSYLSPVLAFWAVQITEIFLRYELFIIRTFSIFTIGIPALFGSPIAIGLYYAILIVLAHHYAAPSQEIDR